MAMHSNPHRNDNARAFSILELLSVIAIITIMMALMLPAMRGFGGVAARKGAVTTLMNTFEQARVAALEAGRPTFVVFLRRQAPEQDAVMVLRETEDGTGTYEQLSRWIKLPQGVLLHQPSAGESLLSSNVPPDLDDSRLPNAVSPGTGETINYLQFTSSGAVAHPNGRKFLKLIISEGVRGDGGNEQIISDRKQDAGAFEIISLSQFTGRSQLDYSSVPTS